jgi:uncharacterized protein
VIGPWEHLGWGRPESPVSPRLKAIGPAADSPVNQLTLAWFDHFLKGADNGVAEGPRVDYFVMGENAWRSASQWPLPGTAWRRWYLASAGHANSVMGDGVLSEVAPQGIKGEATAHADTEFGAPIPAEAMTAGADRFDYDPRNPVPSLGGHSCCSPTSAAQGQFDQAPIEQRPDILVFTSAALREATEVTGPVTVELYAASDAPDTDFTAKLVDVHPDGTAVNLSNGIIRASYRASQSKPTPITPGRAYKYEIHLWATSNLFQAGHRIRLEISSSDYPQFAPNPNTGLTFGSSAATRVARQTVLHDAAHPSAVVLPVIPAGVRGSAVGTAPVR